MLSAISFGVFCRSAPSTSAIIRSRNVSPGFARDPHDDLVGQHAGAAGDRRAVAARLADHRRRLAGDRRLVDRRDALDDVAVARDHLAGGDDAHVADLELRCSGPPRSCRRPGGGGPRSRRGSCAASSAWALPASFGHRLGEVGEQHGEPQERGDEPGEHVLARLSSRRGRGRTGSWSARCRRATTNITGLRACVRGSSLRTLSTSAPRTIAGSNSRDGFGERVADRAFGARARARTGDGVSRASCALLQTTRCSTMGPSARAGKKVRPATMRTTPTTQPGEQRRVGRERARGRRQRSACGPASRRSPSTGMIRKNRPTSIAMPSVVSYHCVSRSGRRTPSRCCSPPT